MQRESQSGIHRSRGAVTGFRQRLHETACCLGCEVYREIHIRR